MTYAADAIQATVNAQSDRLFAPYTANRPKTWACDQRTKDIWCIGTWINEELIRLNVDDRIRIVANGQFHRYSRSDHDLWVLAAECMNDVIEGRIDPNRRSRQRWG